MKTLEKIASSLDEEIQQYEKAISKLTDNDAAIFTLLSGYKAAVEELTETYIKLRSYKEQNSNIK